MAAHAKLSASGSKRWLACPPSANLEKGFKDDSSVFAEEGTFAHALSEMCLSCELGVIGKKALNEFMKTACKNEFYSAEMVDYVDQYVTLAMEKVAESKSRSADALVMLEQRLDFSRWVPEGFGTGDLVVISDGVLEVVDLKYGKGVPVEAEGNTQMMLYGLGALHLYDQLYDIDLVQMTICQPRLDSVTTMALPAKKLLDWAENYLKPRAEMAMAGEGEYCAGEHCKFCKARYTCRARAEANMELAKLDFALAPTLSADEIAEVLAKADALKSWATDIAGYALEQAERHGVRYPGWKLVEGRSNRKYLDETKVADKLLGGGLSEEQIYERSLLGITAMEKAIGKKMFSEMLKELIVKPAGKPALVPEDDKRPELNSTASAAADFAA